MSEIAAGIHALRRLAEAARQARQRRVAVLSGESAWSRQVAREMLERCTRTARLYVGDDDTLPVPAVDYRRATTRLGGELELLVYDAWCGFDPDALGALCGTVVGGGLILLLAPPLERWPAMADPAATRIAVAGYAPREVGGRLLRRFARTLRAAPDCWIWAQGSAPPGVPAAQAPPRSTAVDDPDCLTPDQAHAVALVHRLGRRSGKQAAVLTADRGRGKSAALGIAAARLMAKTGYRVIVTAPRRSAAAGIFQHARRVVSATDSADRVLWLRQSLMEFRAPDALIQDPPPADLLLVDEAAGIPAPILEGLLLRFPRVVFATTVHGYEGTGRGFALRFADTLARLRPNRRTVRLDTPVRWAPGDPAERFFDCALLLDAEPAPATDVTDETIETARYRALDRDRLATDESLLGQLFGLLVNAHYRTTPTDLRNMLDGPSTRVHAMMAGEIPLAAALTVDEGPFDPALSAAIWLGWRRPRGHLLPQSLAFHGGLRNTARLRCRRVMRIAVHPAARRRGLGQSLLHHIGEAARGEGVAWLGTSFGATTELLEFWTAAGLRPVRLGHRREASSGAHAVMMVKGLTGTGTTAADTAARQFQADLPVLAGAALGGLEPALRQWLGHGNPMAPRADETDWLRAYGFAYGNRPLAADLPALKRCLTSAPEPGQSVGDMLARRCVWEDVDLDEAVREVGIESRKHGERLLRQTVAEMLSNVTTCEARRSALGHQRLRTLASRVRAATDYRFDRLGRISAARPS